ncbi:MAG: LysE family transporter [Bacteroidota bacterium]|nr:LysE family transporter [Bacteroidota bacterium]
MIIGVAISAPLGPMAMIVVQRSLNKDSRYGFLSGIGVAASDITYAIIAAFSLSIIIGFIVDNQLIFTLIGASVLMLVGIKLMLTDPIKSKRKVLRGQTYRNLITIIGEMYLMTLTNPASLFILAASFAGFGIIKHETPVLSIVVLLIGVTVGTISWWFALTRLLSVLKKRIRLRHLFWINRIAGILIITIGLAALISVFFEDFI